MFDPSGSYLVYSTFLGGEYAEVPLGIAVDDLGTAWVTGSTGSLDYPVTADASDSTLGGALDAFITRVNEGGTALLYSTYHGGEEQDDGRGIALGPRGNVHVAGWSEAFEIGDAYLSEAGRSGTARPRRAARSGGRAGWTRTDTPSSRSGSTPTGWARAQVDLHRPARGRAPALGGDRQRVRRRRRRGHPWQRARGVRIPSTCARTSKARPRAAVAAPSRSSFPAGTASPGTSAPEESSWAAARSLREPARRAEAPRRDLRAGCVRATRCPRRGAAPGARNRRMRPTATVCSAPTADSRSLNSSASAADRSASYPHGMTTRTSGRAAAISSHSAVRERSPDLPSTSSPPARSIISGTQCPATKAGRATRSRPRAGAARQPRPA